MGRKAPRQGAPAPLARHEFLCWVEDAKQQTIRERRIRRTQEGSPEGSVGPAAGRDAGTGKAPAGSPASAFAELRRHRRLVVLGWRVACVAGGIAPGQVSGRRKVDFWLPNQPGTRTAAAIERQFGNGGFSTPFLITVTAPAGQKITGNEAAAPAKAVLLNLISRSAVYGFLVLFW